MGTTLCPRDGRPEDTRFFVREPYHHRSRKHGILICCQLGLEGVYYIEALRKFGFKGMPIIHLNFTKKHRTLGKGNRVHGAVLEIWESILKH